MKRDINIFEFPLNLGLTKRTMKLNPGQETSGLAQEI